MLKKHIILIILYIIVGPLCSASLKHCFLQSPFFQQAQSALIGQLASALWLAEHIPRQKCNAPFYNRELQLSKLMYGQLIMSLVLPSVPAREGNRVAWQTQWWYSYVFAHKPRLRQYLTSCTLRCDVTLSLSLSLTLSPLSIANTLTNNKTYSHWFRSARLA